MNIGVDIDGVLADNNKFIVDHTIKYFADRGKPIVNAKSYSIKEMFGLSEKDASDYFRISASNYINNIDVMQDAKDVIEKLKKDGHKIIINTARPLTSETLEWLKHHGIMYDEFASSRHYNGCKLVVAKKYALDVHIDDAVDEIKLLSPRIPVIIFDTPYNTDVNINNTYRARNWNDIYKIISEEFNNVRNVPKIY